jgi:hypothetical protein
LSGDTGAFWFFSPDNLELVAKVLDGQPVNGRWWVFYGSLTDVEFHLTVRDLPRKLERTYHNPPGVFASRGDTTAFPGDEVPGGPAIGAATGDSAPGGEPWAAGIGRLDRTAFADPGADPVAAADPEAGAVIAAGSVPPGPETYPCPDLPITLCLRENRFLVEVTWSDPHNGGTGTGTAVPLTGDTGAFWFFDDDNVELVVKVLDGRPVNGYWWVFYGSLTDVEFHLTVTDQATQTSQTYDNPPLSMASRGITDAFSDGGPFCPICSGGD